MAHPVYIDKFLLHKKVHIRLSLVTQILELKIYLFTTEIFSSLISRRINSNNLIIII